MENIINRIKKDSKCAVIVAHPDDETLWAGGMILMNPDNDWTIITACRKSDPDRSCRFDVALKSLNAVGYMGDMDDGPDQIPLDGRQVEETILSLLKNTEYDIIFTHSTQGEYTRHRRHEEVADAVIHLIASGQLKTKKLWMFAYNDGNHKYFPKPIKHADVIIPLFGEIWKKKYDIITQVYGFAKDSWEAKTAPRREAFWSFSSVNGIKEWLEIMGELLT